MVFKMPMPKLGMTMETGKILQWFKQEGEKVEKGEVIAEIDTDKVSIKIESPAAGTVLKLIAKKGDVFPIKNTIALIGDPSENIAEVLKEVETEKKQVPPPQAAPRAQRAEKTKAAPREGKVLASPRAKALAQKLNIDLNTVKASRQGGEIIEADVIQAAASAPSANLTPPVKLHPDLKVAQEVDITGIRKVISDRMYYSLQTAAQLTLTIEVDMGEASSFRQQVIKETGEHISFTDVLLFATAYMLAKFPKFNASVDPSGEFYSLLETINVGIATAADKGLLVPVLRDVNKKSLPEIARKARDLTSRARADQIQLDELAGGTFTVTNLGMYGIDAFTPIVNPPEIAILGVGQILEKPTSRKGAVIVRPMMVLSISFDHRIIDGHEAAQFLQEIKQLLESGTRLMQLHNKMMFKQIQATQTRAVAGGDADALAIVIGCGPAGQAFAERITELGGKVIVVEKDLLGGTCLNRGCVPIRTLQRIVQLKHEMTLAQEKGFGLKAENVGIDLSQVTGHKRELVQTLREGLIRSFEQQKIEVINGSARVVSPTEVEIHTAKETVKKRAKYLIIATGAQYQSLHALKGSKAAPLTSSELLDLNEVPKSLVLVGYDYVAVTFASIFAEMGCAVTIVAPSTRVLPDFEEEIVDGLLDELGMLDVKVILNATITGSSKTKVAYKVGTEEKILQDTLIANLWQRAGNAGELGLEKLSIEMSDGFITTTNGFETSLPSILAIGDVTNNTWRLSHKASEEGRALAEKIMGNRLEINYNAVPKIVFSHPPIAAVGATEAQLKVRKGAYRVMRFPFARNAFAHVYGDIGGMVKILAEPSTGTILGVSIIGIFAPELIAECALAMKQKMTVEQLALIPQIHPSIAELLKDAMFALRVQEEKL